MEKYNKGIYFIKGIAFLNIAAPKNLHATHVWGTKTQTCRKH